FGKTDEAAYGAQGSGVDEEDEDSEASRRNQPTLTLIQVDTRLADSGSPASQQPGRLAVAAGATLLTFYTNDTVANDDFASRAKQALTMFDQDKNGYLEPSEVPESLQNQLGRFEAVDVDEDGKIYVQEIEVFLAQQQAGLRAQVHARATDSED